MPFATVEVYQGKQLDIEIHAASSTESVSSMHGLRIRQIYDFEVWTHSGVYPNLAKSSVQQYSLAFGDKKKDGIVGMQCAQMLSSGTKDCGRWKPTIRSEECWKGEEAIGIEDLLIEALLE